MNDEGIRIETKAVHAGRPQPRVHGAVTLPIFQSATFESRGESVGESAGASAAGAGYHDLRYLRLSNTPNHDALHARLAALENAEAALVTASGMAAISTTMLSVLAAGDHLLAQDCLYGGTHDLVSTELPQLGIEVDFIDGEAPESWERLLRPTTRAIYVETMTNPLLEVADLEAVVAFARAHDLVSIIDNTFASPINFRPAEHGFDLSLHSATKYLNGHSDIVAGAIIGRKDLVRRAKLRLDHLGASLDPHACFLLERGLKTLPLRVRQQGENALLLARFLAAHPAVTRVEYPGLESHRAHARARTLFEGAGGVLSFELAGGAAAAHGLLARLRIPTVAPSLGGVETLVTIPALTSHAGLTAAERRATGIAEGLVRLAVGIEAGPDLLADFEQALAPLT